MAHIGDPKKQSSVAINLGDSEGIIEKVVLKESGAGKIRVSCLSADHSETRPLELSEAELASLLYKAIRAGILSREFMKDLHSEVEI